MKTGLDTITIMDTKLQFEYKHENKIFSPSSHLFRPGDIVSVKDWGERYSSYTKAFKAFGFEEQRNHDFNTPTQNYRRELPKLYKLMGVLEHEHNGDILCHIRSRLGHNFVFSIYGLKAERVYPLRIGEKNVVKVKKIK